MTEQEFQARVLTELATLNEKMQHPCALHLPLSERMAVLESAGAEEDKSDEKTLGAVNLLFFGISLLIATVAVIIAIAK